MCYILSRKYFDYEINEARKLSSFEERLTDLAKRHREDDVVEKTSNTIKFFETTGYNFQPH